MFDVIIIGGGHNGLVCACDLASKGRQVAIFERRTIVGGAAVTEEFHPGFRNSSASYTVGLLDPKIVKDLRLKEQGLEIVPRVMANFLPSLTGDGLSLYNDDKVDAEEIAKFSDHDSAALSGFRSMLKRVGDFVRPYLYRVPPNLDGGGRELLKFIKPVFDFVRLENHHRRDLIDFFTLSMADLLGRWFEDTRVKAAFAFDAVVGHHGSLHSPGSAYGLLHHALGEVANQHGVWGHPIGGMGAITQAMCKQALVLGVHIETDAEVASVIVNGGQIQGVRMVDGTIHHAPVVAANSAPKHLYLDLLTEEVMDSEFRKSIANTRTESAVLRINVALSELPQFTCRPSTGVEAHHRAGIVFGPSLEYLEDAYLDARRGRWSKAPLIEMLIPSTVDSTLAPEGMHVASLFCQHFPYDREWDEQREHAADVVFRTIDQFAPNFSNAVIAREVLTPLDLERRFRLPQGDIFHGAHIPSQLWFNRPVMGYAAYQGLVPGLYHCGAGAHPGGGVSGIPGRNAARKILRDTTRKAGW